MSNLVQLSLTLLLLWSAEINGEASEKQLLVPDFAKNNATQKPVNTNTPPLEQVPRIREVIEGDPDSPDAVRRYVPIPPPVVGSTYAAGGDDKTDREVAKTMTSPSYYDKAWGNWGSWTGPLYCPDGQWAVGAQQRVEEEQYKLSFLGEWHGDDTSMNAFRLLCAPLGSFGKAYRTVEPHTGYWGGWGKETFCDKSIVVGFQLRTERSGGRWRRMSLLGGFYDKSAASNMRILCSDGAMKDLDGGNWWGEWTDPQKCPKGTAVCGAWAQVEQPQGRGDDTALNNIAMDCCKMVQEDCTPSDKWETIAQFDNQGTVDVNYDYSKTTGVSSTETKQEGGSQEDSWKRDLMISVGVDYKALSTKFSATLGTSSATKVNWSQTTASTFSTSVTEKASFKVPAGTCFVMRQVVGVCGYNIVRTPSVQLTKC